jgi:hypothetical protein
MGWKGFAMSILQFPAPKNNVCRKTQKTNEKTNKKHSRKISLLGRNMLLLGVLSFENDIGIGIERERDLGKQICQVTFASVTASLWDWYFLVFDSLDCQPMSASSFGSRQSHVVSFLLPTSKAVSCCV